MIGVNIGKFFIDLCAIAANRRDIADISNESGKEGMRIVIELKNGADYKNIENMLYKKTKLEDTFGVNMLVIDKNKPEVMGLKDILNRSIEFQYEINTRKYSYLLRRDLEAKEIKEGLIKACDMIDLIIEVIRGSKTLAQAKTCLMTGKTDNIKFKTVKSEKAAQKLSFTENQAQAILDLRLAKLIGLEIEQLKKEYDQLVKEIARYEKILSDKSEMKKVIIKDLEDIKTKYAVKRKTKITNAKEAQFIEEKKEEQEVVLVVNKFGYAKLLDVSSYEKNKEKIEEDNNHIVRCMNTDKICIFTDKGNMHQIKAEKLSIKKIADKGIPIDNLCNYKSEEERVIAISSNRALCDMKMLFITKKGMLKMVDGTEFDVSKMTVASTKLAEGDEILDIHLFGKNDNLEDYYVILRTCNDFLLKFKLSEIPEQKKTSVGVRGIKLGEGDMLLEAFTVLESEKITIKDREVKVKSIKTSKRDGKGSKV